MLLLSWTNMICSFADGKYAAYHTPAQNVRQSLAEMARQSINPATKMG
jgi:hypothetical protein